MSLRPPWAEQRLDLRRSAARPPARARPAAGQGGDRGRREVERELLGRRARAGVREHGRADLRLPVDGEPREVAGHGAAVADEEVLAAAVELEPRPPGHRPAGVVDHRADVRHLLERRRPAARGRRRRRGTRPSAPGRPSSTRACRARRRRRDRARARAGRRPSRARRSSRARPARTRPASCATGPAARGSAPAAPPPRCRRGRARRPRRAARRRGWSSATTCPDRAPALPRRSRRADPRATAPSSSPRSRPVARAGARRSARACGRSSARARSPAGAR